jgi:ATP-dependent helicase/nuclease subunit B
VADRREPALYSIPPHRAFADALVEGLIAQFGGDKVTLAQGIIILPNNRAVLAVQDAFVRRSESGLLLPRLVPIGDPELSENVGVALDPMGNVPIPPSVDPLTRQMILARLLQQNDPALDGSQAMRLAADLAKVLDQLIVERVAPSALRDFDAEGLSQHWSVSLATLSTILDVWPKELDRLGAIDLADRRNRQIDRLTELWRNVPPKGFVIAAGISTGAPAIADLLKVVARLEEGQVVFAGLDLAMPKEEWDAIAGDQDHPPIETHPQFHLRQLLDRVGAVRAEVDPWPWGRDDKAMASRAQRVSLGMAPAAYTHKWVGLKPSERALPAVHALELATPAEEAMSIALALRRAIETPEATAALVTPDRALAARVSAILKRWGIEADDSAGRPLSACLPGTLILALAAAAADAFSPVSLLTLIKHPFVRFGEGRLAWLDGARALDMALRGPRPAEGLEGIASLLAQQDNRDAKVRKVAQLWWEEAGSLLAPLAAGFSGRATFADLLRAVRETAQSLAGDIVWSGPDGRAISDLIAALEDNAGKTDLGVSIEAFPLILRDAMDAIAIRPARGGHPRLFIWGLLEAKLQSADLMILAGLNEGVWPKLASPDPWLAPAVRKQLKLPSLERRIGLTAHDLTGALGSPHVLLTRAKRDARSPTNPSRFWLRLETLTGGFSLPEFRYDLLARQLDFATGERAKRPAPSPPIEDRPRTISVTAVDRLKADPYAFYAQTMLGLQELAAPGEEPDARWRGTFLHDVLGKWGQDDDFSKGKLLPRLIKAFQESGLHPVVRAMWEPRFEEAIQYFEDRVEAERANGRHPVAAEMRGEFQFGDIKLHGRFDRIDVLPDGQLAIVDYKTGAPPEGKQVAQGYALQLGLIGLLAECGAYPGIKGQAAKFEYWSQGRKTGKSYGYVSSPTIGTGKNTIDPDQFVADLFRHFEAACEKWLTGNSPFTAKEKPEYAYSEFDQLMRYDEWQGRDG